MQLRDLPVGECISAIRNASESVRSNKQDSVTYKSGFIIIDPLDPTKLVGNRSVVRVNELKRKESAILANGRKACQCYRFEGGFLEESLHALTKRWVRVLNKSVVRMDNLLNYKTVA